MKIFAIFLISFAFSACYQKTFDSKEVLMKYLQNEENGYIQKKTVNGVDFSLMYRPTDLFINQELRKFKKTNDIDSLRRKYNNYFYFNLVISKNQQDILSSMVTEKIEYDSMVNQLFFGIKEKMHLVYENDTLPILDYIYPRNYGMSNNTSILLVYPKLKYKDEDNLKFILEDLGLYTGDVTFKLSLSNILDEPQLRF